MSIAGSARMGLFLGPLNIFLVGIVYWLLFLGQRWWGAHGADPSILDGGLSHLSSGSTPALFGSEHYPSANPVFEESPVYGRFLRAPPVGIVAKITAAAATVAILFLLLRCFTSLKRYATWEANRRLAQGGSPCQPNPAEGGDGTQGQGGDIASEQTSGSKTQLGSGGGVLMDQVALLEAPEVFQGHSGSTRADCFQTVMEAVLAAQNFYESREGTNSYTYFLMGVGFIFKIEDVGMHYPGPKEPSGELTKPEPEPQGAAITALTPSGEGEALRAGSQVEIEAEAEDEGAASERSTSSPRDKDSDNQGDASVFATAFQRTATFGLGRRHRGVFGPSQGIRSTVKTPTADSESEEEDDLSLKPKKNIPSVEHGPKPPRKMKDEVQHIVGSLVKSSADGGGEKESYRVGAGVGKDSQEQKEYQVAITKALAIAAQKGHIKHDIVIPTGPTPGMPPRVEYVKVQDWSADASPSPKKRVWQNLHSRLGEGMIPGVEDIVYQHLDRVPKTAMTKESVQAGMTKPDVDAPGEGAGSPTEEGAAVEEGASESGVDVLGEGAGSPTEEGAAVEGATSGPGHAEGTVETPQVVPTSEPQVSSDVADEEDDAGAYEDIKLKLAGRMGGGVRPQRTVKRIAVSTVESAAVEGLQEDSDGNEEEGSPEDDPAIDPFDEEAWMNRPFTPVAIDPDVTARHHQEAMEEIQAAIKEHDARLAEIRDRPLGAPPSEALLAEEDIPSADLDEEEKDMNEAPTSDAIPHTLAEATSSLANERRPIWNAHLFGPSTRKYWNFGHPASKAAPADEQSGTQELPAASAGEEAETASKEAPADEQSGTQELPAVSAGEEADTAEQLEDSQAPPEEVEEEPFDEEAWMNRPISPVYIDPEVTARHYEEAMEEVRMALLEDERRRRQGSGGKPNLGVKKQVEKREEGGPRPIPWYIVNSMERQTPMPVNTAHATRIAASSSLWSLAPILVSKLRRLVSGVSTTESARVSTRFVHGGREFKLECTIKASPETYWEGRLDKM